MLEAFLERHGGLLQKLASRLTLAAALWLAVGLGLSACVVWAFAEITEDVLEGDTRRFDRAVLLWINAHVPDWLEASMRLITVLGYYRVVVPLLAVALLVFYLKGWKLSAALLLVSTVGGMFLTTVLKAVFRRSRPELFDPGYEASFFSFPSGHATVAVGFYGMLILILAYRSRGFLRWLTAAVGVLLILLIGFSRLYLGVHYPTDVMAGYLSAPLWVILVGTVYVLRLSIPGLRAAAPRRRGG